jgi:cobalt-zinc-cadmium resistance protein CzcA
VNNVNAGGSFNQEGLQQVNVRALGLVGNVHDIEQTVIKTQNGTALRTRDIATVTQGPKIRLGRNGKAIRRADGRIVDSDDVVEGIVLLRKGAEADATLKGIEAKVQELNDHLLPRGVTVVPFLDRSALVRYTTHTVLHNLTEGIVLVVIVLFLFLGSARGALIVALTIPFSLLFAAICLDLRHVPANLLSLGALDFGMVVDGAVVMVENIVRRIGRRDVSTPALARIREAAHEVQRPVFYAIAIIITAYLPIFTLQAVEGRLQADGVDGRLRAGRRVDLFDADCTGDRQLAVSEHRSGVAQSRHDVADRTVSAGGPGGDRTEVGHGGRRGDESDVRHPSGVQWCDWLGIPAAPR